MNRVIIIFFLLLVVSPAFCNEDKAEKIKYRKLTHAQFMELSINDTSSAVIDLFFRKKDNAVYEQMSTLPVTVALYAISPPISIGLTAISLPLFINGSYTLIKFRKKKLHQILTEYKKTKTLPKWIRRKTERLMKEYEVLETHY